MTAVPSNAPYTRADYTAQTGAAYKANLDAAAQWFERIALAFAPSATAPASLKVQLQAGFVANGTAALATEIVAQQSATLVAPVTNPRWDIVYIDTATGAVGVAGGAEAASPADPAVPAGKLPIARIVWTVGAAAVANSMIADLRSLWMRDPTTARGDLIARLSTGLGRLAKGSAGDIVSTDGTDVLYQSLATLFSTGFGAAAGLIPFNEAHPGSPGTVAWAGKTLSEILDAVFGAAVGTLIQRGAAGYQALLPSAAGKVLTDGGPGAIAGWGTAAAGLTLIEAKTLAAVTSIDFTTGISGTYDEYVLEVSVTVAANATMLAVRMSTDGGVSYAATGYYGFTFQNAWVSGALDVSNSQGDFTAAIPISGNVFNDANRPVVTQARLYNLASASLYKNVKSDAGATLNAAQRLYVTSAYGEYESTTAVNALRLISNAIGGGNGAMTGWAKLYGVQKS